VIVGVGFTVTLSTATLVLVHPVKVLVPVTVYEPLTVGVNATPSVIPPVHVYVSAPPPIKVVVAPSQITELEIAAVTTGKVFTVTLSIAVFVQPVKVFVPVTV
jgi:hypothetical protein